MFLCGRFFAALWCLKVRNFTKISLFCGNKPQFMRKDKQTGGRAIFHWTPFADMLFSFCSVFWSRLRPVLKVVSGSSYEYFQKSVPEPEQEPEQSSTAHWGERLRRTLVNLITHQCHSQFLLRENCGILTVNCDVFLWKFRTNFVKISHKISHEEASYPTAGQRCDRT